jgi:ATP-binding cassette subfamily A (ABC1) protein 1
MLTGILAPSGGDAFFQGFSFKNNMKQIRQSLGLCFQHDVLYKELTVEEHLIFYARIKGYTGEQLNEVVQTKIKEVGLTEKRFVRSAALSGGMKRKLSVAISLLGDSSLVFLDEPTSGMDPYSRRSTWEILLNNRQNRVVVLTTHFMDEADILGDRIAIMAEGELRCCGSSLFLKNRYGAGYNFTLVKDEGCKEVKLIEFVSSKVPSARVLSNVGAEIAFQLPLDSSSCFASMFEQLDANLKEFGILQYGISVTTMEEVFIKVAEAHDEENQHTLNKEVQGSIAPSKGSRTSSIAHLSGFKMFLIHLQALLFKRFRVAKRDRRVLIFSAILPVILLFAGFALLKSSSLTKSDVKLPLNTAKFKNEADMPIPFYCEADDDKWCSFTMENLFEGGKTQKFTTEEMGVPPYTTNPSVFGIDYSFFSPNETFAYCLRFSDKVFQRAHGLDESHEVNTSSTPVLGQYAGYLIHGSSKDNIFGYNMFLNTTATHGGAIFKALMDESIYRFFASNGTNKGMEAQYNLTVFQYPLPFTATTKALFGSFLSFTACLFIVIAFAFFPASIVVFLVKEKQVEHNSKHQQLVSGVSIPAFWLSNYIWDLFTYILPFAAAIILIKTFDVSAFTGNDCNSCTN